MTNDGSLVSTTLSWPSAVWLCIAPERSPASCDQASLLGKCWFGSATPLWESWESLLGVGIFGVMPWDRSCEPAMPVSLCECCIGWRGDCGVWFMLVWEGPCGVGGRGPSPVDVCDSRDMWGGDMLWWGLVCEVDPEDDDVTDVVMKFNNDCVCNLGFVSSGGGGPRKDPGGKDIFGSPEKRKTDSWEKRAWMIQFATWWLTQRVTLHFHEFREFIYGKFWWRYFPKSYNFDCSALYCDSPSTDESPMSTNDHLCVGPQIANSIKSSNDCRRY